MALAPQPFPLLSLHILPPTRDGKDHFTRSASDGEQRRNVNGFAPGVRCCRLRHHACGTAQAGVTLPGLPPAG